MTQPLGHGLAFPIWTSCMTLTLEPLQRYP